MYTCIILKRNLDIQQPSPPTHMIEMKCLGQQKAFIIFACVLTIFTQITANINLINLSLLKYIII